MQAHVLETIGVLKKKLIDLSLGWQLVLFHFGQWICNNLHFPSQVKCPIPNQQDWVLGALSEGLKENHSKELNDTIQRGAKTSWWG